jgi:hypothetical protein
MQHQPLSTNQSMNFWGFIVILVIEKKIASSVTIQKPHLGRIEYTNTELNKPNHNKS